MLLRTLGSGLATNQVSVELEHWSVLGSGWGEEEMGQMFLRIRLFIFRKISFLKAAKCCLQNVIGSCWGEENVGLVFPRIVSFLESESKTE